MSEDLRTADLVRLMGWPWWLSLVTLVTASTAALLSGQTSPITLAVLGAMPGTLPRLAFWTALLCAGISAILALLAGPRALGRLLARTTPAEPVSADAAEFLAALRQMLHEERGQLREAATAIRGAASVGVQLATVAQDAEQRLRLVVEQCQAAAPQAAAAPDSMTSAAEGQHLLTTLRQTISEIDSGLGAVTSRLSSVSQTLEQTVQPLPAPQSVEDGTARLEEGWMRLENLLAGSTEDMASRLREALGGVAEQTGRTEAVLTAAEMALAQIPGTLERLQITGRALIQSAGAVEAPALQLAALAERCEAALCGDPQTKGGIPRLEEAVRHLERLRVTGARQAVEGEASLEADSGPLAEIGDLLAGTLATLRDQTGALTSAAEALSHLPMAAEHPKVRVELSELHTTVQALADRLDRVERTPERLTTQITAALERLARPSFVTPAPHESPAP